MHKKTGGLDEKKDDIKINCDANGNKPVIGNQWLYPHS
jgi:hypothetical protein